jgi:hypothetical protein
LLQGRAVYDDKLLSDVRQFAGAVIISLHLILFNRLRRRALVHHLLLEKFILEDVSNLAFTSWGS